MSTPLLIDIIRARAAAPALPSHVSSYPAQLTMKVTVAFTGAAGA